MRAQNKVIVVTGAGSGMGREVALELIRRGARVAAVDLNPTGLAETVDRVPSDRKKDLVTYVVNVADRTGVEGLPARVAADLGPADGLIHCAGIIQPFVRLKDLDYPVIERVFQVNFWGTLYLNKTFLPGFLARPEAHIVNISSMGGFLPVPGQTIYGASKAAVKLLTEGLHSEVAGTAVRVTVVFPGAVATNITQNSGVAVPKAPEGAAGHTYPADRAARDIVDGMEKNRYRVMVGDDSRFVDLLYRLSPRRAAGFIAGKMKDLLDRK
jgi:NAD(P)-dependent dehydrogenase (short-subunit alcohol dehydrogenase family)